MATEREGAARRRRVHDILGEALDLPSDERIGFIEGECADSELKRQVLSVLDAYESDTDVFREPLRNLAPTFQEIYGPGTEIGPYRIEKSLGAGGMGAVFLARRSDDSFDKKVALKLIKRQWASADEVSRFRRERQILADLEHPSIAQLLDGGNTAEGHPYLVMEYVEGRPVDVYCRDESPDLGQKLDIFLQVCSAVQFAHQRLIVHRDLKPGNILVGNDGRVKLLDFGIAKILDTTDFALTVQETRPGASPMTLAYASPEQIRAEAVTTATDVYALGILLYQLLTGRRPYSFDGANLPEAVDAICNRLPTAPSEGLRKEAPSVEGAAVPWRKVQGDLDAIVLKALAKEPERRYPSAQQLADDLERFRASEPVRARKGTLVYRTRKFLYRHRLALSAAATVLAVLVGSIFVLLGQQERLIFERNQAQTVTRWMTELFELPDPGRSLGESVTARELLDKSRGTIHEDLAGQPDLLRQMLTVLGRTYGNLGLLTEAEELSRSALALAREQGAEARQAELLAELADLSLETGRFLDAYELAREAVDLGEGQTEASATSVLALARQGTAAMDLGRSADAEALFDRALEQGRRVGEPRALAEVLERLIDFHMLRGRYDAAEASGREALDLLSNRLELHAKHPEVLEIKQRLLSIELFRREPEAAIPELEQVVAQQIELHGPDSPFVALSYFLLGDLHRADENYDESERYYREALRVGEAAWGSSHMMLAGFLNNYGMLEAIRGNLDHSAALFQRVLEITERESQKKNPLYGNALRELALIDATRGRLGAAEEKYFAALEILESVVGPTHRATVITLNNIGSLKAQQGDKKAANEWYRRAVEAGRKSPHRVPDFSEMLHSLAVSDGFLGNLESAMALNREILDYEGADSVLGLKALTWLGIHQKTLERWPEAEASSRRALTGWQERGGFDEWEHAAMHTHAVAILEQGRASEAVELLEDVVERWRAFGSQKEITEAEQDLARARELAESARINP